MFETAELGRVLPEESYDRLVPDLRTELLKAQVAIGALGIPVVVLLHGVDASGRGEVLNLLHEWLDARYVLTETYEAATEEERERPEYWRYWQWLPPRGKVGAFLGSWYTEPLWARVLGETDDDAHEAALRRIESFERTLIDDGALIVKIWLHIKKSEQKRRLKVFDRPGKSRRRVTKRDWEHHAMYGDFVRIGRRTLTQTSTGKSPWAVIDAADDRFRNVSVGQHLLERMKARIDAASGKKKRAPPPSTRIADPVTILDTVDLSRSLSEEEYRERLPKLQGRVARLAQKLAGRERSAVVVFEGWDAAGKGGAIRRITSALDARQYRVIPISAPTDEERAHHYLWRFWRHVPRHGRFTIYDRSWYGRVLVERVEGYAEEAEWQRAYKEINDFEEQLVEDRDVVVKFWLQISKKEQLRRFQARRREPWKQHKLTADDFRNRAKSNAYELAANEMLARTDSEHAPWTLVEAENKHYCRVKVLETLCKRLEEAL